MDALQRKRFCEAIDCNFSVIAPAGVGKTFAIVERIFTLADKAPQRLPLLHVITYTRQAAESLQQRAQERLKTHPCFGQIVPLFRQTFFGTIHSLCQHYILRFDPQTHYNVLQDSFNIRTQFLSSLSLQNFDFKPYERLLRFIDLDELLSIIDSVEITNDAPRLTLSENFDLSPIYDHCPKRANVNIDATKAALQQWEHLFRKTTDRIPFPTNLSDSKPFAKIFQEALCSFFDDLGKEAIALLQVLSKKYFDFRIQCGVLQYKDLIDHAKICIQNENARQFFTENPITLLLDEAQDTDGPQFDFLETLLSFHSCSQFSMVGDPQQAIYGRRAQVKHYLDFHQKLIQRPNYEAIVFSKTFRCPNAITQTLNQVFPTILNPKIKPDQVAYVPLVSGKNDIGSFQIIRIPSPPEVFKRAEDAENYELPYLLRFLKNLLSSWTDPLSQICILAPRKAWLTKICDFLSKEGLNTQIYSSDKEGRQCPYFCRFLTWVHLINFPEDSFELAGLLVYGFQIDEAVLTQFSGSLQIANPTKGQDLVAQVLNKAYEIRQQLLKQSVWQGTVTLMSLLETFCIPTETIANILLCTASETQALGQSWAFFEQQLRQYLHKPIESNPVLDTHAIQCYTCHKAKGLEWDTVIVPFFFRPITYTKFKYPLFYDNHIFFNKDHQPPTLAADRRYELERLLYVTCTRAKKNLIFIDDKGLWSTRTNEPSFGDLWPI